MRDGLGLVSTGVFIQPDQFSSSHCAGMMSDARAITAPKSEAFSPPTALLDPVLFVAGNNDLTHAERLFAKAYTDLGRPDLAGCVTGPTGRLHQRLRAMIGFAPIWGMIVGLEGILPVMWARAEQPGADQRGGTPPRLGEVTQDAQRTCSAKTQSAASLLEWCHLKRMQCGYVY